MITQFSCNFEFSSARKRRKNVTVRTYSGAFVFKNVFTTRLQETP